MLGFSIGPIPSGSVDRWIRINGLCRDEGESFRLCIRAMDRAFLDKVADKENSDTPVISERPLTPALFTAILGQ